MGKIDRVTKKFIKDDEVFADAVNLYHFNGVRRVLPEYLNEMDSSQTVVIMDKNARKTYSRERYRDALKKVSIPGRNQCAFMITGFENQTRTDRSMPVRNMLYDSMSYMIQVDEKSVCVEGSFPQFPEGEKLLPVMTIVINFGKEPWSGPLSLHELLDTQDKKLLKRIPDYRINILDPHKMSDEEIERAQSNLREVLYCIKYSDDKDSLSKIVFENKDRFEKISLKARNVIENISTINMSRNSKGGYNMCKAIEDMKTESENIGYVKGVETNQKEMIEALKASGASDALISDALKYMERKKKEEFKA